MKNVTSLKCWPELEKLGFEKINFRFNGKLNAIGAALRKKHIDINGKEFYSDIICIEPHYYKNKPYHITGEVKTPYCATFYRYDFCRKVEFYEMVNRVNDHFNATDILKTVQKMIA